MFGGKRIGIIGEGGISGKAVACLAEKLGLTCVAPERADIVVASPGVPLHKFPKTKSLPISEIEFAYLVLKEKSPETVIISVTGTNGKSTTTSMIAHLLGCEAVGNIGVAFSLWVAENLEKFPDFVAVEVSSYQLETIQTFCPDVSLLLNITPDHLERHGTMEAYADVKSMIVSNQQSHHTYIYNDSDPLVTELLNRPPIQDNPCKKMGFTQDVALFESLKTIVLGDHNAWNGVAAILAAEEALRMAGCVNGSALATHMLAESLSDEAVAAEEEAVHSQADVTRPKLIDRLKTFQGLPHRIEFVTEWHGHGIYNDSKATNFDSTTIALRAFPHPVMLILGGYLKPYSQDTYDRFLHELKQHASHVVIYGAAAEILEKNYAAHMPMTRCESMEEALDIALQKAEPDQVILFSPGYSSFDQFKNFEERGDVFKAMVHEKRDTSS